MGVCLTQFGGFCGTAVQANVAFCCREGSMWCDVCKRFAEAKGLPTPQPTPTGGAGGDVDGGGGPGMLEHIIFPRHR